MGNSEVRLTIGGVQVATVHEVTFSPEFTSESPPRFVEGFSASGSFGLSPAGVDRLFKSIERASMTRYWFKRREWYRARENRQFLRAFRNVDRISAWATWE